MVLLTTSRSQRTLEDFWESGEGPGPGVNDDPRWGDAVVTSTGAAVELQKRPPLTRWKTKSITPGPGAYNLRRPASESSITHYSKTSSASAGVPFRSNLQRISKDNFKEPLLVPGSSVYLPSSIIDNPGPGQYDIAQSLGKSEKPLLPPEQSQTQFLSKSLPSFPPLRKPEDSRYTGRDEDTLSPGDYEYGSHAAMHTVLKHSASATDFHSSSSQRRLIPKPCSYENTFGFQSNPVAPGNYELRTKLTKGTSQPFSSKESQRSTAQPFKSKSCSTSLTPGPGAYPREEGNQPLNQHFQRSVELSQTQGSEAADGKQDSESPLPSAGYRSKITREGLFRPALTQPYTDSDSLLVPGPGHYPRPASIFKGGKSRRARTVMEGLRKRFLAVHTPQHQQSLRDSDALQLHGFASTQERGCLVPDMTQRVAEPGTYNPTESMGQSIQANLRQRAKIAKEGAFGSTKDGDRFFGFPLNGRKDSGPAPGDRDLESGAGGSSFQSSVDPSGGAFRSKGQQRPPPEHPISKGVSPGPGHYSSSGSLPEGHGSTSSSPSKSVTFRRPKTEHLSFGSCTDRFGGTQDAPSSEPGPGDYSTTRSARPAKRACGAAKSSASRQLAPRGSGDQKVGSVGPGMYDVGGTMADLSTKTFNRTASSVAVKLQEAANKTRGLHTHTQPGRLLLASDAISRPEGAGSSELGARSLPATVQESPES